MRAGIREILEYAYGNQRNTRNYTETPFIEKGNHRKGQLPKFKNHNSKSHEFSKVTTIQALKLLIRDGICKPSDKKEKSPFNSNVAVSGIGK